MARKLADIVLVAVFVTGTTAYAAASLRNAVADQAGLIAALQQSWRALPIQVEEHFNTHLAGRPDLVAVHARLKADWLGASPNPKVWLGRNGWLFLNHAAEPGFMASHDPALAVRLDHWAEAMTARRTWLAERGIKYLVVAAPDKQTIYPDFLPRLARQRGPTPLDGLLERCARDPNLTVLDLREPLRAARPAGLVYRLTDSHWTAKGMYAGYDATVTALARWYPSLTPLPPDAFTVRPVRAAGGDLARLLGVAGGLAEDSPRLEKVSLGHARPVDDAIEYVPEPLLTHVRPRAWVNDEPGLPRVLLLGDSFADDDFCCLLAEHCSRLVRVGSYQGQEALIEREKPDVVLGQFVERMLAGYVPKGPRVTASPPLAP
jgi:alginate O-acetyltransferase complex protein AlgJ